jgi:hypothetical protein
MAEGSILDRKHLTFLLGPVVLALFLMAGMQAALVTALMALPGLLGVELAVGKV